MVDFDDSIRIQLENGYNHWEFEGGIDEQKFIFHHEWSDIDRKNKLTKDLIVKKFYNFFNFMWILLFVILTFLSWSILLWVFLMSKKVSYWINDFGDEIIGYLEFIDMNLFDDALHLLGYNSVFTYVDNKWQK